MTNFEFRADGEWFEPSRTQESVSRWLSDAAGDHLRNQLLGDALGTWEAEDGPFSRADLDAAARTLGVSTSRMR